MKFYENLWKSMNAMKINKNHANSLEVNGDQLSLVEFTVYWYSLGVLLVSFRSKPKVLQPANPPASQPANPPTRQPASQPASQPPGACVLYKENLPFSSIWFRIRGRPSKTDPFERRVLQQV